MTKTEEIKELIKELEVLSSDLDDGDGGRLSYEESCAIDNACYYLKKAYLNRNILVSLLNKLKK